MLNNIQKIISYIFLGIIILFAFAFLSKQFSLTYHLRERLLHTNNASFNIEDLKNISRLHEASARVFLLAFFSFLVIITGFAIVMSGIHKAYDIAEVKEKVRTHLKSTTTGLLMIIAGLFLLAFCSYKHSSIEAFYSSRLVNYSQGQTVGAQPLLQDSQPLKIDSSMMPSAIHSLDKIAMKSPLNHKGHISNPKLAKTKFSIKHSSSQQSDNSKTAVPNINGDVSIPLAKGSALIEPKSITEKDMIWANQLEKNTVVFGYVPHHNDRKRYDQILQENGADLHGDIHWAFQLLEKTQNGYSPRVEEMKRYEKIVEGQVTINQSH